jgi:hypothetical protein
MRSREGCGMCPVCQAKASSNEEEDMEEDMETDMERNEIIFELVSILVSKDSGTVEGNVALAEAYADEILRKREVYAEKREAEDNRRQEILQRQYGLNELQHRQAELISLRSERELVLAELKVGAQKRDPLLYSEPAIALLQDEIARIDATIAEGEKIRVKYEAELKKLTGDVVGDPVKVV